MLSYFIVTFLVIAGFCLFAAWELFRSGFRIFYPWAVLGALIALAFTVLAWAIATGALDLAQKT